MSRTLTETWFNGSLSWTIQGPPEWELSTPDDREYEGMGSGYCLRSPLFTSFLVFKVRLAEATDAAPVLRTEVLRAAAARTVSELHLGEFTGYAYEETNPLTERRSWRGGFSSAQWYLGVCVESSASEIGEAVSQCKAMISSFRTFAPNPSLQRTVTPSA